MNKLLLIFAAVLCLSLSKTNAQTVTVTQPNGGEVLYTCQTYLIKWNITGGTVSEYYDIEYSLDGGTIWSSVASNYYAPTHQFSWTVPSAQSNTVKVRVKDKNNAAFVDISDANFTINIPIVVTAPNGGQTLTPLTTTNITWTANGTSTYVNIYYSIDGGGSFISVATNVLAANGTYTWTIPNNPSTNCIVKVQDASLACMNDVSNLAFTINPLTPLVNYPNGGENLNVGQYNTITWSTNSYYSNVKIEYSLDNGTTWISIVTSATNNGSYGWYTPYVAMNKNYSLCLVKVSQVSDLSRFDVSNANFTIRKVVNVSVPNGGEVYSGCGTIPINSVTNYSTDYTSSIQNFTISYSINGGSSWSNITTGYTGGLYNWSIPNTINSTTCKIRIMNNYQAQYGDTSDNVFTIAPSTDITVTSPNGGESFAVGSLQTVTWSNTVNVSGSYTITYSSSAGSGTIATNVAGNSYNWTVPNLPATDYRITVRDYSNSCKTDQSDANFTVLPQTPIMTYPNGSELFNVGQYVTVTWNTATYYSNVRIDYSLDNGTTWITMVTSATNNGSYGWYIPYVAMNKNYTQCLVKVSQANDLTRFDVSNANFTIRKVVNVSVPNGGEVYSGCGTIPINSVTNYSTDYTSSIQNFTISYSINGGSSWSNITTGYTGGLYNWSIPNTINSTTCKIRIMNNYQAQYGDTSDNVFTIAPSTDITVTSPNGGESFAVASIQAITWSNTVNVSGSYTITYSSSAGSGTIATNITGNSYNWTVPNLPATDYRITVRDYSNSCKTDQSDANFTVLPQTPIMTYPNGSELFNVGQYVTVTWNTATYYSNVKIEYSLDNGVSWLNIVTSATNNGSYGWYIPYVAMNKNYTQCLVKVLQANDLTRYDVSNANFTIRKVVNVSVPNGGEVYSGCGTIPINTVTNYSTDYTSSIQNFTISYSTNGGSSWSNITTGYTGGLYNWSIPNSINSTTCKIRVMNNYQAQYGDTSDNVFTITPSTDITVTSPNGGENFTVASSQTITWSNTVNVSGSYTITYSSSAGSGTIASNITGNSYTWTVPNLPATDYRITVRDYSNSCKTDQSDANFTVAPQGAIMTYPNGSELFNVGQYISITWNSATYYSNVKIEYTLDNGVSWLNVVTSATNNGSYGWYIPYVAVNKNYTQCLVKVSQANDLTRFDVSNANFTIRKVVNVSVPNGGEVYSGCGTIPINSVTNYSTDYTSSIQNFTISYSTNGGSSWSNITTGYTGGLYNWSIPNSINSTTCKIRIMNNYQAQYGDTSDNVFTIAPSTDITVTSPNGGESFAVGSLQTVTWSNTINVSGSYTITYSSSAGSGTIATNVTGNSYNWTVPNLPATDYRITVRDYANSCKTDQSDANFTVLPQTPIMTYPNGSEVFNVGQYVTVTWNTATYYSNVRIDYSLDNGTTWATIVTSATNNGSYGWYIPYVAINKNYTQCLVKVFQANDLTRYDVSNANFTIRKVVNVSVPNGGEVYTGCGTLPINSVTNYSTDYTSSIQNFTISYSTNGGSSWSNITTSYTGGLYNWSIPNSINSTTCKIRIMNNYQAQYGDSSDGVFSILPSTDITVTSPNGGESFSVGSSQIITWTNTANVSGAYTVTYSSSAGSGTIASNVTGNTYAWTVPNLPATDYRITVRDYANSCKTDQSDANFTVLPQTPIMTAPNGGQTIYYGEVNTITWNTATYYSNVKLELTTDGGTTWNLISSSVSNSGSYSWTETQVNVYSTNCKIRVSQTNDLTRYDVSDNVFTIKPAVTILTPNGGESIGGCTVSSITIDHTSVYTTYTLQYSLDNGGSWTTLTSSFTTSAAHIDTYNWNLPNLSSAQTLVRAYPNSLGTGYADNSNAVFTIVKPVTIIQPNFGGNMQVGSTYVISWSAAGTSNLYDIYYSTNGGSSWIAIVTGYNTSLNTYSWTVPNAPSTNCLIKIRDNVNICKDDISDVAFTISSTSPPLTVTAPNGGENWTGCSTHDITWSETSVAGSYNIAYSINNGSSWVSIVSNYATTAGTYTWQLPNINTTPILVRVQNAITTTILDASDALLTLTRGVLVALPSDTTVCPGSPIQLSVTGGTTYTWNPTSYLSATNISNPVSTPTGSVNYIVQSVITGCALVDTVRITVNTSAAASVSIAAAPSVNICSGTSVTFTATPANGGTAPAYQWKVNGGNVGTNSATYTSTGLINSDVITCVMTSNRVCVTGNPATSNALTMVVTNNVTPSVSIAASQTTICAGMNITFTATPVNGGAAPSYQWKLNGSNVGTNSAAYSTTSLANADVVSCVLTSNASCASPASATSNSITINTGGTATPSVSISTSANNVCSNTYITFTATNINGGYTPVYQWKVNGVNAATGTTWTTNTLNNNDVVSCVLTSSLTCASPATATSNSITMIITGSIVPSIVITPSANNVCAGTSVVFNAAITNGGSSPAYLWKLNGTNVGTGSSYTSSSFVNNDVVTCILTSNLSCVTTTTATSNAVTMIVNPTSTPTISISASATTICTGTSVTFTPTIGNGGGSPAYQWKVNGINVSTGNTYSSNTFANGDAVTCVLTSSNTCASPSNVTSNSVTMVVNLIPTVSASNNGPKCNGTAATLTATGATTYSWSPSTGLSATTGASVTATPGATQTYTISGTTAGCTGTATTTLTINSLPTVAATNNGPVCAGTTASLTATGASTYSWSPGSLTGTTVSVSPASTTTYTVTGTDINGCVSTGTTILTINQLPNVTATNNGPICVGSTATLTASGASSFVWSTTETTTSISVNPTTTTPYTVTGTDANNCSNVATTNVVVNTIPVVTASNNGPKCNGVAATLTASGASTYLWSPSTGLSGTTGASVTATPSSTQTYTVSGTTAGCTGTATTTLIINPLPTVSASNNGPVCSGTSAVLTGTGAITYSWNPGTLTGATPTVNPTSTTTYVVSGTDGNGCVNTASTILTINQLPLVTATNNGPICIGASATLTASGASSFVWSTSETATSISVTPSGTATYTVTGTDANNCSNTASTSVVVNNLPTPTASSNTPVCEGGTLNLSAGGGTSYQWWGPNGFTSTSQNPSLGTASTLAAGTYHVKVTNAGGCIDSTTTSVVINASPAVPVISSGPTTFCAGGSVTLVSNYSSGNIWSTSSNTDNITVTASGNYTVTYTDGNGCSSISAVTLVTVNPLPNANAGNDVTLCNGSSTTLNATGGGTYLWSPSTGLSAANIANPVATPTGTQDYIVTVTSAAGCSKNDTVKVTVAPSLTADAGTTASICNGSSTGLNATGGTTYSWSPSTGLSNVNIANPTANPTVTTQYTVTVSANGCANATDTVTVLVKATPVVTANNQSICTGSSATLTAAGTPAGGTYLWSNNATTASITVSPTSTTTYTVAYTLNGCTGNASSVVTFNSTPTVTANNATICSGSTGTLTATGSPSGGTYLWSNSATTAAISVSPTTTTPYTVTYTLNGCATSPFTSTVTVNNPPAIPTITQSGAVLTSSSATGNQWYLNGVIISGATSQNYTATQGGTYTVTVTSGGCSSTSNGYNYTVTAYCTPNPATGTTDNDYINGVALGTISNLSSGSATGPNYTNYTATMSTNLTRNTSNTINITSGGYTPDNYAAWIDYNADGDFADAGEKLGEFASSATFQTTGITFTVPVGATLGNTRLRVRCVYANAPLDPCTNYTYGETEDYTVIINATASAPVANFTASATAICSGTTVNFTNSSTGSPTSYSWTFTGGTPATSTATNPSVVYNTAGTYNVVLVATNANGSNTMTKTGYIVVTATPTVTANNASICAGSTATLTAAGSPSGGTYLWSNSATTAAISVSPATTTPYTVTYTLNGCSSSVFTSTVTVNTPATPAISQSGAVLTSSSATGNQWYLNGVIISGATAQTYTPVQAGSYTVTVTASGCSATSNPYNYSIATYCTPNPTTGTSADDFIDGVVLGSINNTASGSTGGPNYTDYTATLSTNLARNSSNTINIIAGNYAPDNYAAWIDYNADGDFADAGEKLGEVVNTTAFETLSIAFTVPATATLGNTRLRVRCVYNNAPLDPCINYVYGETEDYKVIIDPVSATPPVANFSANSTTICAGATVAYTNTTTNGVSYSWTFTGGTPSTSTAVNPSVVYNAAGTYNVILVATNANGSNTMTKTGYITVNSVPAIPTITAGGAITNLCPGTTVTLTSSSATGNTWAPNGATTQAITVSAAGSYTVTVTGTSGCVSAASTPTVVTYGTTAVLPFLENFEGTWVPTGWTIANPNGDVTWKDSVVTNRTTGTRAALMNNFDYNTTGKSDYLYSPTVSLTGVTAPKLKFDVAYARYNATYTDTLQVLVSTNCGATWTSVYQRIGGLISGGLSTVADQTTSFAPTTGSMWRTDSVILTSYAGSAGIRVAFRNKGGWGNNLYLDNINITGTVQTVTANFTAATTTVCAGQTVSYTNTSTGSPTTYSWTFAGGTPATSTAANPVVTYNTAGTYTASLTASNGASTNTKTNTSYITVNANPTPTITQTGVNLTASGSGLTYQWYLNGSIISGATSQVYTPVATGNYTVVETNTSGCSATSSSFSFILTGVVQYGNIYEVNVYPNPTNGLLTVELNNLNENQVEITVLNVIGALISSESVNNFSGNYKTQFDLSSLANGVYFVKIVADGQTNVKRIIKQE